MVKLILLCHCHCSTSVIGGESDWAFVIQKQRFCMKYVLQNNWKLAEPVDNGIWGKGLDRNMLPYSLSLFSGESD